MIALLLSRIVLLDMEVWKIFLEKRIEYSRYSRYIQNHFNRKCVVHISKPFERTKFDRAWIGLSFGRILLFFLFGFDQWVLFWPIYHKKSWYCSAGQSVYRSVCHRNVKMNSFQLDTTSEDQRFCASASLHRLAKHYLVKNVLNHLNYFYNDNNNKRQTMADFKMIYRTLESHNGPMKSHCKQ